MLKKKFTGMLRLFRPELPFAAGVCVMLGEVLALGTFPSLFELMAGFLCGFFMSGSAMVLNDYFDLEVDRINAPNRPLPSGDVAPFEAVIIAIASVLIALTISLFLSISSFVLCVIFWWVGFLYNWKFKASGLAGNLMVSASVGITFILGGMIVEMPWSGVVWLFSLIVFLFDLGEEIAGDAMDEAGDRLRGSKSIAILLGRRSALRISAALFMLVMLVILLPFFLGWLGLSYLLIMLGVDAVLIVFTFKLLKSKTPQEGRSAMRTMYLTGSVGLLAFLVVRLVGA